MTSSTQTLPTQESFCTECLSKHSPDVNKTIPCSLCKGSDCATSYRSTDMFDCSHCQSKDLCLDCSQRSLCCFGLHGEKTPVDYRSQFNLAK
jgi:hypothetical protein